MYLLIKYYSKHIVARMHGTVQLYFQLRESIQLYLYNYIFNYQHFTNVFLTLQFFKIFVETSLSQESRYKVESLHTQNDADFFISSQNKINVTLPYLLWFLFLSVLSTRTSYMYVDFSI